MYYIAGEAKQCDTLGWRGESERNVLPNLARRMMPQVYYLLAAGLLTSSFLVHIHLYLPPPPPMSWNYEVF